MKPTSNILPLFSSPVYKEETTFRVNVAELKTIRSLPLLPYLPPPKPVGISKDHEIFKQKAFKRIKNFMDERAQYFFKKILFLKNELVITESWISRAKPEATHPRHKHPNALFSIVYYVDCPSSYLRFSREHNFLEAGSLFSYDFEKYTIYTAPHWTLPVTTGDLLIFPASMAHESSPNTHTTDKLVVGANYFFKKMPTHF